MQTLQKIPFLTKLLISLNVLQRVRKMNLLSVKPGLQSG